MIVQVVNELKQLHNFLAIRHIQISYQTSSYNLEIRH